MFGADVIKYRRIASISNIPENDSNKNYQKNYPLRKP